MGILIIVRKSTIFYHFKKTIALPPKEFIIILKNILYIVQYMII